jgi:hypothetical protein
MKTLLLLLSLLCVCDLWAQATPTASARAADAPAVAPPTPTKTVHPSATNTPKPRATKTPTPVGTPTAAAEKTFSAVGTDTAMTAQESEEYTRKIREEIEAIKNLNPEEYVSKIDQYRLAVEKYIDHKKRVCNGEFSTIILSDSGEEQVRAEKRLGNEERKLCFREMKAIQISYINNMYSARKKYLDYLHALRIEELSKVRDQTIKSLQNSFEREERRR